MDSGARETHLEARTLPVPLSGRGSALHNDVTLAKPCLALTGTEGTRDCFWLVLHQLDITIPRHCLITRQQYHIHAFRKNALTDSGIYPYTLLRPFSLVY